MEVGGPADHGLQSTLARLRTGHCFRGKIYVVTAPLPTRALPYEIADE
jgi:hypothetical protein